MQNYDIWIQTVLLLILKQNVADDVEIKLDTSNCKCNRPLPTGKTKNVIGLMKDE